MTTTPGQTESAENARFEPVQGGVVIWDSISHMMNETAEQAARDMLERMGIEGVQSITTVDLMELTNLIAAKNKATPAPAWEPLTPKVFERLEKEDDASGMESPYYWLADSKHGRVRWGCFSHRSDGHICFNDGDLYFDGITHIMPFITPEMPKA